MATSARRLLQVLLAVVLVAGVTLQGAGPASAATPIDLGLAAPFAVLAGTPNITNTGPSEIHGDVGISPALAVIGLAGAPGGTVIGGTIEAGPGRAADAKLALTTAYDAAANETDTQPALAPALNGVHLVAGVYSGGALNLAVNGTITLDGQNDPAAVFIIRASSSLVMMSGSTVALTGLAQACNVFWQVTSSATIGTNAAFVGTVLALSDIQAQTGATIQGRLLARNGQVTLDDNRITKPTCAAVVPPVVVPVFVPPAVTTTTTSTTVAPTTTTTSTTSTTIKKVTTPTTAKGTTTPSPVAPGTSDASVGSDVVTPVAAGGRSGSGSGSGAGGSTSEGTRRDGSSSTAIGGGLPRTGSSLAPWAVTGLIAVLLGGSITVLAAGGARRRS